MLREHQNPLDPMRRWFSDEYFDLIVWLDESGRISGFQLCYDRGRDERALTWSKTTGTSHARIDAGESTPLKNRTPVLVPDGIAPFADLAAHFEACAQGMDRNVCELIRDVLRDGMKGQRGKKT